MTTFVLVHGAWHGAWCWERLIPELERHGHTAVAVDLPMDDASATFEDYADVVLSQWPSGSDIALVGHSLGGMVVPLVSARRDVRVGVFLCSVVPNLDGLPWDDAPAMGIDDYGTEKDPDGAIVFRSLEAATHVLYQDCTPDDAEWAFKQLKPLRNASLWDRPYPLTKWPASRAAAIACQNDIAIYASYQRHCLRYRLGIDVLELPGHHSPFLSRPALLADTLHALL